MPASYPSAAKTFTTKSNNTTADASHINDLQLEVTAIEQDLLAGSAVARGGTGNTSLTANRVLLGNGTSAIAVAGAGTQGQVLTSNGASAPTFQSAGYTIETTTSAGATNDFDLDAGRIVLRCTGAAPIFSGFTVAGTTATTGDVAILECLGTTLKVTHQDSGSSAANQIICESAAGQIVGAGGRILLIYDGTTGKWRATVLDCGTPITPAFSAGDYTADTGTWTVASGDVTSLIYVQRGKTVWVGYVISTTTVASSPNFLRITIPGGFTSTKTVYGAAIRVVDSGTAAVGYNRVNAAGTIIEHGLNAGGTWGNATDTTFVYGQLEFEVN